MAAVGESARTEARVGSTRATRATRASGKQRAAAASVSSAAHPATRFSLTLVMVTLVMVGLMGTLRLRKHALERSGLSSSGLSSLSSSSVGVVLTPEQLSMYDGRRGAIYIGILGRVYDVTTGARHYGPGGSYSFFAGRDASRAYVTGKFKDDLNDDVRDLEPSELSSLVDWRSFYQKHETYSYVGTVVGRLYDGEGVARPLLGMVEMRAAEFDAAMARKKKGEVDGSVPKVCSFRWHKDEGGRVSCAEGFVPRKVKEGGEGEKGREGAKVREVCRCLPASVAGREDEGVTGYDGCALDAASCKTGRKGTRGEKEEL